MRKGSQARHMTRGQMNSEALYDNELSSANKQSAFSTAHTHSARDLATEAVESHSNQLPRKQRVPHTQQAKVTPLFQMQREIANQGNASSQHD